MKNPLEISEVSLGLRNRQDSKISTKEFKQLTIDYEKITGRVLKDCEFCIITAFKMVRNYVNLHNPKQAKTEEKAPDRRTVLVAGEKDWSSMKLPELRKLFPEIKAVAKDEFIEKIGDYRVQD